VDVLTFVLEELATEWAGHFLSCMQDHVQGKGTLFHLQPDKHNAVMRSRFIF
jgi:hypothetical protein